MLRITATRTTDAGTLKVEGRLAGLWVDELSRAATAARADVTRVVLDLGDVTFVDAEGIALLRTLRDGGFALAGCSSFVASLIDGGMP
jgi:anti-anti-sigma regulatory factor